MKCSRCQSRHPNAFCYVCREEEEPPDTPDEDGGSLLQSLCRVITTCAMFLAIGAIVWFAANQLPKHSIAALCIAGFFAFAAAICRQDAEDLEETDIKL